LTGILFVLLSAIPWELLPREMGCGSGVTCWRRLRDWQAAGIWDKLYYLMLNKLQEAKQIDWARAVVDSSTVRAVGAGKKNRAESDGSTKAGKQTSYNRRHARRAFALYTHER
jgi:transposase